MNSGLYIHIPFCTSKCRYCDFNSILYDRSAATRYIEALAGEIALLPRGFKPQTVFIGGGTPTCLSGDELKNLFHSIGTIVDISLVEEFSVEANPGTVDVGKMQTLTGAGVNRISLGAQSFEKSLLGVLGRAHGPEDIYSAVDIARSAGVSNISLDLIFAVPGQTPDMWRDDLRKCCDIGPQHISTYCLTYEPGTPLFAQAEKGKIERVGDDVEANMYLAAMRFLTKRGYRHYDVSNFALPGRECRHNLLYWRNRTTYAVGAGAYSYVEGIRRANTKSVEQYINMIESDGSAVVFREDIPPEDRARETAMLMLRTGDGIDKKEFARETGFEIEVFINDDLKRLVLEGYLLDEDGRLSLTNRGFPVADSILVHLMR